MTAAQDAMNFASSVSAIQVVKIGAATAIPKADEVVAFVDR